MTRLSVGLCTAVAALCGALVALSPAGVDAHRVIRRPSEPCDFGETACEAWDDTTSRWARTRLAGRFVCVNTDSDIEMCGACRGQKYHHDCTAIPDAIEVRCVLGVCQVTKCAKGLDIAADGTSCRLPRGMEGEGYGDEGLASAALPWAGQIVLDDF